METRVLFHLLSVFSVAITIAHATLECRRPNTNFPKISGDYTVAYEISNSNENVKPCYSFSIGYEGALGITKTTFKTKKGTVRKAGTVVPYDDGTLTFAYNDNPTDAMFVNVERKNGVYLIYMCKYSEPDNQVILVAYNTDEARLSAAADKVARELTETPFKFKVPRRGCAKKRPGTT